MNLQLKKAGVSALFVPLMVIGASVLPPAVAAQTGNAAAVRGLPDFTDLVDQVGPSVVNIRTMERVRSGGSAGLRRRPSKRCRAAWGLASSFPPMALS